MKKLNVPFIPSREWECGQACAAMMIKYFYPDFEPDFDVINKIIHHKRGMFTFPPQNAILLDTYFVKTKAFSSDDLLTIKEDPEQFKRWFKKDYEYEMRFVDQESFNWMVGEVRKRNLFEVKKTNFQELINLFTEGYLVCFPIDWVTLTKKEGAYQGHFVILIGTDSRGFVLIHDPDIGASLKFPPKDIKKAWSHPSIAQDYFVAYGKK